MDFVFLLSIQLILLSNGERVSVSVEPCMEVMLYNNNNNDNNNNNALANDKEKWRM